MTLTGTISEKLQLSRLLWSKSSVMKTVCFCLALFAVSFLIDETLGRRMSLRAKRKRVLRKYLEKEARLRNDTLMQRLLYEESSKFDPNDPTKPPWPKSYEDISHYTLPPHLVPGPNESALDNSDFVHEMIPALTRKSTKIKTTTKKRNRTTSKYKKKLASRVSTTLSPEVVAALRNFTVFSFLNLTPPSLEEDTQWPMPSEKLDPSYYTYLSKAWTTKNTTNSSTTVNITSTGDPDEYDDFGNPTTRIENAQPLRTADLSKVLEIVKQYERLTNVGGIDGSVGKTNGNYESKVRSLIQTKDKLLEKEGYLLNCTNEKDCESGRKDDEDRTVQYNDYNERDARKDNMDESVNERDSENNEQNDLIEDLLSKYCRENPSDFEKNLKNDAYYNTLRRVVKLFVEEMGKNSKRNIKKLLKDDGATFKVTNSFEENCTKSLGENNENKATKPDSVCDDSKDLNLNTMKPLIHRRNRVKVGNDDIIITVKVNLATEDNLATIVSDNTNVNGDSEYNQKNLAKLAKDSDAIPKNISEKKDADISTDDFSEESVEESSKNDKLVAEYLLKNKLNNEINRVNDLIDELNAYNASAKYEHIHVEQNASLHELVENLRRKRSKSEEDYLERERQKKQKKSHRVKPLKMTGKPETASKEKYYYPKVPTYDPGDELWKQAKRDYETDPKVRKVVDTSFIHKEGFNSKMWRDTEKQWEKGEPGVIVKRRKRGETPSEEEYYEREYQKKMKADFKKRVLDDESPETTEGTTPDNKWLDISRSQRKGGPIDINDFGLSHPSELIKKMKKRDLVDLFEDDVFERYDPVDSHFVEDLAQHAKRRRRSVQRHNTQQGRHMDGGLVVNKIKQSLARHRRRREAEKRPVLDQENVPINKLEYDMYHGLRYGATEVAAEDVDLTGLYSRYTAASVGPYQKKRYEKFRQYFLAASSTFRDPFMKVSFAVCPFCGDFFGNHEKMRFHQDYNHFNIFSTAVQVTDEPTSTVAGGPNTKDINDIFEGILKNNDLALATEKWGDYIDQNINPTALQEYKSLLFNESVTAFLTVPVHDELDVTQAQDDEDVKVLAYPSGYHQEMNWTYTQDLLKSNRKSIPVVNLYENPEEFMKKLINHEPLLPVEEQEKQAVEKMLKKKAEKKE